MVQQEESQEQEQGQEEQALLIAQRYEAAFEGSGYREVGLAQEDRRQHLYIIGKPGMGKTTLLELMIVQDLIAKRGLAVLDPHGDLAERVLEFIPSSRMNQTIYFNPQDVNWPFSLNPFERVKKERRPLVASGILSIFYKLFKDSWGPRLEHILRHAILALLEVPGATLLGVPRLLQDRRWRARVISKISDPAVRAFWESEYPSYGRFEAEAIAPILNKVGAFISNPLIRNIICQRKGLDFSEMINRGKILIAKLPKGTLGEDNQALLGSLLVTKLYLAVLERVRVSEERRRDFYLYVDEFQNFATETFAEILAEARKYRLNLILAHQYLDQLEKGMAEAVLGNVGTFIVFRVGAKDAERLEREISIDRLLRDSIIEDLINLDRYEVYLRLIVDGRPQAPFKAQTFPPLRRPRGRLTSGSSSSSSSGLGRNDGGRGKGRGKEKRRRRSERVREIIKLSRERYCQPRAKVEEGIARWYEAQMRSLT